VEIDECKILLRPSRSALPDSTEIVTCANTDIAVAFPNVGLEEREENTPG
jgi:hypothetical protein